MNVDQDKFYRKVLALGLISFLLCLFILPGADFYGFESRFVVFAKEMLEGPLHAFPTAYGVFYPDYTALSTLLIVWASSFTHEVSIISALVPTACASSFIVMGVYALTARHNAAWGMASVLCLGLSDSFLQFSRIISLDQFVAMASVLSYLGLWQILFSDSKRAWFFIAFLLVFGFAVRGPIGYVIPASIIFIVLLFEKRFYLLGAFSVISGFGLIVCMIALLGLAYVTAGKDFTHAVLSAQFIGRLADTVVPVYFYFLVACREYAVTVPIALLTMMMILFKKTSLKNSQHKKLLSHAALWIVIILVGMSIPTDKKARYVLAVVPAAAMIAGYLFTMVDVTNKNLYRLKKVVIGFCALLPCLSFVSFIAAPFLLKNDLILQREFYYGGVMLTGIFSIVALYSCYHQRVILLLLSAFLSVYTIHVFLIEPAINHYESSQGFVQAVLKNDEVNHNKKILFYQLGPNDLDNVLMANLPHGWEAHFIHKDLELKALPSVDALVMKQSVFESLDPLIKEKWVLRYQGTIGHRACVLLNLNSAVKP